MGNSGRRQFVGKRFTIFYRLAFSYLTITVIMGALNAYTVTRFSQLNREVHRILDVDQRLLDLKEKLADSVISQLGYEKKYLVTGDPVFRDHVFSAENDFKNYLSQSLSIADTPSMKELLVKIESLYGHYQSLLHQGLIPARTKPTSFEDRHKQEKERAVEQILETLKALEISSVESIHARTDAIKSTAVWAHKAVSFMVVVAVVLVIGTSYAVTRSITNPLNALVEKTRQVSSGIIGGRLTMESPPEVAEVARAFNVMCDRLAKADKIKSEFFSAISHELRTPLTAIKQGITLLQQHVGGPIPEKHERLLTILSEETRRLIELVSSLLDLSKMEAGMMPYSFHKENLSPLIEQVITEMTPIIQAKKQNLHVDFDKNVPSMNLDRERMLQVLRNLIGNATKFTPEGGQISVSVSRKEQTTVFSVKDSGPGIPKENLCAIFEKFQQLPVRASEWDRGTGLGLAFVRHIITSHGGTVWAESEVGRGSTFTFILPS